MSHSPEQMRKKEEAMAESQKHHKYSQVHATIPANRKERSAEELNKKIRDRFKEYNEPDHSVFGVVGRDLRQKERKLLLREKYRKEDEGK